MLFDNPAMLQATGLILAGCAGDTVTRLLGFFVLAASMAGWI